MKRGRRGKEKSGKRRREGRFVSTSVHFHFGTVRLPDPGTGVDRTLVGPDNANKPDNDMPISLGILNPDA